MPHHFKVKYSGQTRRLIYEDLPNWSDLAGRLRLLYDLSFDSIGVSYIDTDDDEITVSSDEELRLLYQFPQATEVITLNVVNLSLSKGVSSSPKQNERLPNIIDIIEPWQQFSLADILSSRDPLADGPHAFVEVLNTDASVAEKDLDDLESEVSHSTVQGRFEDKGKGKESTLGAASVVSLVDEEPGEKLPIHVFDHGTLSGLPTSPKARNQIGVKEQSPLQTTPKIQPQFSSEPMLTTQDPPLPTFEEQARDSSPNLIQDLASFLSMLNNVLSSHPELMDGIRNIANHATSGEYWRSYTSSIDETAQRLSQSTEAEARRIEAEAIRTISDVLDNLLGYFSTENQSTNLGDQPPDSAHPYYPFGPYTPGSIPPFGRRHFRPYRSWNPERYRPSWYRPPPPPLGPFVPPPPPPPIFHGAHPPPPPRRPMPPPPPPHHIPRTVHVPPAPPLVPNPPFVPTAPVQPALADREMTDEAFFRPSHNVAQPQGPMSSAEDLRAQVEETKRQYKASKDLYRQERARRREEKAARGEVSIAMLPSSSGSSREPVGVTSRPHVAGPKRAYTHIGLGRHGNRTEDLNTRAQNRIVHKLADMGFTNNSHPYLSDKVAALLPPDSFATKEREDDIVTTLLEELIPVSPRPSASASKSDAIPGAWE